MEQPNLQAGLSGISKVDKTSASKPQDQTQATGPAFQALLERIQNQAKEIKESSKTTDDAASLNKAVDLARASLDNALSLSDSLLEAFREAQQQDATPLSQNEEKAQ